MRDPFPSSAPPVVELRRVTRKFGDKTALDDVSLTVPRGGVFGLIGGNGAGKTTLIKHILGLLKPQSGSVHVFGLDPVVNPVGTLGRIGYLSEHRDLPYWMRVGELMRYSQAFFPNWDETYAEELRDAFDLDRNARIRELSRGQLARAGLLVALAHRPELLLLDEPSSGLDPVVRRDILGAIIRTIADELGEPPVLVGASMGGMASLIAAGDDPGLARALVLVDITPKSEPEGLAKITGFMRAGLAGFDSLHDALDAVIAYNPHRSRPPRLEGLRKNLRERDGRWYWHWDPRFIDNRGGVDGQPGLVDHDRLADAARRVTIPVLLVRGRMSEIVSDESVRELRELIPHAEVVEVAGAGHMVAGDRNDAFNAAVIEFVSRVVPR